MGRERVDFVRESGILDAEKFYILAYEGEVTERKYFSALRSSEYFNHSGKIELIPLKKDKKTGTDPISVKRRLSVIKSEVNFKTTDEFWLIIDRDDWEKIHKISFVALVNDCNKEGNFFIAMSNPCFEFWLLLHFKKLAEINEEEQNLIFENQKISNSRNYISTLFNPIIGKNLTKHSNMGIFIPQIYSAINNAKEIANINNSYPKTLGSDVFKLVEKIIKPNEI